MSQHTPVNFDTAWEFMLDARSGTFEQLSGAFHILRASPDHLLTPTIDWARLERLFYLHHIYDIFSNTELDALLARIPTPAELDGNDHALRLMCDVWVHEWRSQYAKLRASLAALDDPRATPRLWVQHIGSLGHIGDLENLIREHAAFSRADFDDPTIRTYGDCIYLGFSAHLGHRDHDLDPTDLEVRALDMPPVLRVSANAFIGVYYRARGESNDAWRLQVESLKLARWFGHPRTHAAILLDSAAGDMLLGYIERAYDKLLTCRDLVNETSHAFVYGRTYLEEARALLALGHYKESVESGARASATLDALGYHDSAMVAKLITVSSQFLAGDEDAAQAHIASILSSQPNNDMSRWQALITSALFSWHRGDVNGARRDLAALEEHTNRAGDEVWMLSIPLFFVHLLGDSRPLPDEEDLPHRVQSSTRQWAPALKLLGGDKNTTIDRSLLRNSLTGSLIAGLIANRLERDDAQEIITMNTRERSFRFGEQTTSLRRRASLWAILSALADTTPKPVSVDELFTVGWPGEELVDPVFAARRVYWAVGELRRLGLYTVIVTMDPGYALSSEVKVKLDA